VHLRIVFKNAGMKFLALASIFAVVVYSCEFKNEEDLFGTDCDTVDLNYDDIKPIIEGYCLSCHNDPPTIAPFKLNTHSDLIDAVQNKHLKEAVTHAPGYIPMPYDPSNPSVGLKLDSCSLLKIKGWIKNGTP
jgi:hypothetical protein